MISRAQWRDSLRADMSKAFGVDARAIEYEIKNDVAELWEFSDGRGFMVTRLEYEPDYSELVLVAAEGKNIFREGLAFLKQLMIEKGAATMRVHTANETIQNVFLRAGWQYRETVLSYGQ